MDQDEHKEGRLRERAYSLWEQEGRPEGRHEDHWRQASDEFSSQLAGDGQDGGGGDMVPNPIAVPPTEALPPGSQPTGIDGRVGEETQGQQQAGSDQGDDAGFAGSTEDGPGK